MKPNSEKSKHNAITTTKFKISVIIPAHNEEKYIRRCLESIKGQTKIPEEIIVICDSCKDNTKKIAKGYTSKVHDVKFMEVSKVRNYGRQKSNGDIKIYIDADSVMKNDLVEKIYLCALNGYIGGTCKTKSLEGGHAKIYWAIINFFNNFFLTASGLMFSINHHPKFDENMNVAEDTYFIHDLQRNGKVKYIRNSWIKTSNRRFKVDNYFKLAVKQVYAYFTKKKVTYKPIR